MNWGTKLVIGLLTFMSFIVVLGILMIRSEPDALVDKDYYEKGLRYDEALTQKENVIKAGLKPEITISDSTLIIVFKANTAGTIRFMRIADQRMDKMMAFKTQDRSVIIPVRELAKGQWKLIFNWKSEEGTPYLAEQEIRIP